MPAKYRDIFSPLAENLDPKVNPFAARLTQKSHQNHSNILSGEKLKDCQGQWRQKFQSHSQHNSEVENLVLEIGSHQGKVLNQMASNFSKKHGFIGLDITMKRVVLTAEKAERTNNENLFSILGDARQLDRIFEPSELDAAFCFFPDPWEKKKKQLKHRLLNQDFAHKLLCAMQKGGIFWLKTDSEQYFEFAVKSFLDAGWSRSKRPTEGVFGQQYVSSFESLFDSQGIGFFEAFFTKPHE